jgi:hypothetical protein
VPSPRLTLRRGLESLVEVDVSHRHLLCLDVRAPQLKKLLARLLLDLGRAFGLQLAVAFVQESENSSCTCGA